MSGAFTLPPGLVQVSFSGGRTSAYMLRRLLDANGDTMRDEDRVQIVFANTGREMPETLDFVAEVGQRWSVPIAWVEYRPGASGQRFTITGRQGASEQGEPFEALIRQKRFLPNQRFRICTQELKVRPARDYLRSLGWEHWTAAIGIRADEQCRLRPAQQRERWERWYPLAGAGITKQHVTAFWQTQPFDLHLPNVAGKTPLGNCDGCFLKSEAFLAALARDHRERHAWWERMEALAQSLTTGSGGCWSKRYSRRELRERVERMGPGLFDLEGALCQADDGECTDDGDLEDAA
ncbi:MAG: phosphoadenosine phosphosulfate reductase family protein [Pseudomonadota bacterium]